MISIVREDAGGRSSSVEIFSKRFALKPSEAGLVLVHGDYPRITDGDIRDFTVFCTGRSMAVVSGCRACIHPYRLIYETVESFFKPYIAIAQAIRGNRHLYPEVFKAVPALVYLPPGAGPDIFLRGSPYIYVMDHDKLLDRTLFPDRLFLSSHSDRIVGEP